MKHEDICVTCPCVIAFIQLEIQCQISCIHAACSQYLHAEIEPSATIRTPHFKISPPHTAAGLMPNANQTSSASPLRIYLQCTLVALSRDSTFDAQESNCGSTLYSSITVYLAKNDNSCDNNKDKYIHTKFAT